MRDQEAERLRRKSVITLIRLTIALMYLGRLGVKGTCWTQER